MSTTLSLVDLVEDKNSWATLDIISLNHVKDQLSNKHAQEITTAALNEQRKKISEKRLAFLEQNPGVTLEQQEENLTKQEHYFDEIAKYNALIFSSEARKNELAFDLNRIDGYIKARLEQPILAASSNAPTRPTPPIQVEDDLPPIRAASPPKPQSPPQPKDTKVQPPKTQTSLPSLQSKSEKVPPSKPKTSSLLSKTTPTPLPPIQTIRASKANPPSLNDTEETSKRPRPTPEQNTTQTSTPIIYIKSSSGKIAELHHFPDKNANGGDDVSAPSTKKKRDGASAESSGDLVALSKKEENVVATFKEAFELITEGLYINLTYEDFMGESATFNITELAEFIVNYFDSNGHVKTLELLEEGKNLAELATSVANEWFVVEGALSTDMIKLSCQLDTGFKNLYLQANQLAAITRIYIQQDSNQKVREILKKLYNSRWKMPDLFSKALALYAPESDGESDNDGDGDGDGKSDNAHEGASIDLDELPFSSHTASFYYPAITYTPVLEIDKKNKGASSSSSESSKSSSESSESSESSSAPTWKKRTLPQPNEIFPPFSLTKFASWVNGHVDIDDNDDLHFPIFENANSKNITFTRIIEAARQHVQAKRSPEHGPSLKGVNDRLDAERTYAVRILVNEFKNTIGAAIQSVAQSRGFIADSSFIKEVTSRFTTAFKAFKESHPLHEIDDKGLDCVSYDLTELGEYVEDEDAQYLGPNSEASRATREYDTFVRNRQSRQRHFITNLINASNEAANISFVVDHSQFPSRFAYNIFRAWVIAFSDEKYREERGAKSGGSSKSSKSGSSNKNKESVHDEIFIDTLAVPVFPVNYENKAGFVDKTLLNELPACSNLIYTVLPCTYASIDNITHTLKKKSELKTLTVVYKHIDSLVNIAQTYTKEEAAERKLQKAAAKAAAKELVSTEKKNLRDDDGDDDDDDSDRDYFNEVPSLSDQEAYVPAASALPSIDVYLENQKKEPFEHLKKLQPDLAMQISTAVTRFSNSYNNVLTARRKALGLITTAQTSKDERMNMNEPAMLNALTIVVEDNFDLYALYLFGGLLKLAKKLTFTLKKVTVQQFFKIANWFVIARGRRYTDSTEFVHVQMHVTDRRESRSSSNSIPPIYRNKLIISEI